MLGNKRVTKQPVKLFNNGLISAVVHILILMIAMHLMSRVISFSVDKFGYTQLYQSTLGKTLEHRAQSRLFELNTADKDLSESVLLVGEPGFFTKLLKAVEGRECAFNAVVFEIPDYSFTDVKYRTRSKSIAYKGLEVKSMVFQNASFLWTSLATHSSKSTYDLWSLHSRNTNQPFDLKKINLFFEYVQAYFEVYLTVEGSPQPKELEKVYDFQQDKFERVFKKNHARINFLLDENQASYITDNGKEEFDHYFGVDQENLKHRNWREEGIVKQVLGCTDAG